MNGYACICEAVDIFEASLTGSGNPITTVAHLAMRTGYSQHHFSRLFHLVTGIPPKEYILSRILTTAAEKIVSADKPLSAIAWDLGFTEYETFSRAFKKAFGAAPRYIRTHRYVPISCRLRWFPSEEIPQKPLELKRVERKFLDAFTICGLQFFIGKETASFRSHWEVFLQIQQRIVRKSNPEQFCQHTAWIDETAVSGMSVLCGIEVLPGDQEPIFTSRHIPKTEYLRFVHTEGISSIHEAYRYIYLKFLAGNNIKTRKNWEFQRYSGDDIEIFIPLDTS